MLQKDTFEYAVKIRRQLHQWPEVGFDLPKTLALVKGELDSMGIPYTEEFGLSSIVATINPACKGFTIGVRGDMDALPMQEETGLPYASQNPGKMHACGHDAHTAILLGLAKELKAKEQDLHCRVKLLFTPAEEYIEPGCKQMAENGVMDDIDCCVACHVNTDLPVGVISNRSGGKNANSMGITVEFFGLASHAAGQQKGKDAISMAVEAYTAMEIMVAKEINATEPRLFNVGTFHGGETNNIICDYCKMFISSRSHSDAVSDFMLRRITEICEGIAKIHGGEAKVTVNKLLPFVINHPVVVEKLNESAVRVLGAENVRVQKKRGLGGEDFGFLSRKKPCAMFNLGTVGEDPATRNAVHKVDFRLDEGGIEVAIKVFLQFILDNMDGMELEET